MPFRRIKNIGYLLRTAKVLGKHDALFFLNDLPLPATLKFLAKTFTTKHTGSLRDGERLAIALQELGPTYIKLGQALSTRADILGEEVTNDLTGLQDSLPSFPFAQVEETIFAAFKKPIAELYASFEKEPVAAASIAQVHFAKLHDGSEVAVKILRPQVQAMFTKDIAFFYAVAKLVERSIPKFKRLKLLEVVRDFENTVRMEMDLRLEAAAASELRDNFENDAVLYIPKIYWDYTAEKLLTIERIHGIKIDDIESIKAAGIDVNQVLNNVAYMFFNQVYRDGFFHADMHPGNVFVGENGKLIIVDFGITGRINHSTRVFLAEMLSAFLQRDYQTVADIHFRAGYVPPYQSREQFAQALRSIGEPVFGKKQGDISIPKVLGQMFKVTEEFQMETQPQLLLLQKTMMLAEGISRKLNPEINFWELSRPLIENWMRENMGIKAGVFEALKNAKKLPFRMQHVAQLVEQLPQVITAEGLKLHPDTISKLLNHSNKKQSSVWKTILITVITTLVINGLLQLYK